MVKLVLKVEDIEKIGNKKYHFDCKDKFGIEYWFESRCYKAVDTYILVSVNNYNIVAGDLGTAEQILLNASYIKELKVINGRLNAKGDILKEVKDYILNIDLAYLKSRLADIKMSLDYSCEDIGQLRDYKTEQNRILRQIERYNNLKGVA